MSQYVPEKVRREGTMKKKVLAFLTGALFVPVLSQGAEIGLKLGNAQLEWSDGDNTTLDGYASVYFGKSYSITPLISIGPFFEIGYGKKEIGAYWCIGYGLCTVDLTYTTLELNGKVSLTPVPLVEIFGGAGVSYNRFGLDAKDYYTGQNIGTVTDETGSGFQGFGGAQLNISRFGIGVEYKYKKVNTDSIDAVSHLTLTLSLRF